MEKIIYHKTFAAEDIHWWFRGRRRLVESCLARVRLPEKARILEVGCGSGGNFPLLSRYGEIYALELDETAREYARSRNLAQVVAGKLPDDIPYQSNTFDLIVMTDVLEHVEEDELSLKNLRDCLGEPGYVLVTVPAFPALWSRHDELHHHKRRYTRETLSKIFLNSGYEISYVSYINTLLSPVIAAVRLAQRFLNIEGADDLVVPPVGLNQLLTKIYASERLFLEKNISLPIGISLLLLAKKA